MNSIHILAPEEARRIAAGEVIDRPAALIREFLDNAIDAGANNIDVIIEGGGISKTEVADDGCGMSREDIEICHLTHATSKIRCLDDLESAQTLGFRGEALAAAAAVSHLEIISNNGASQSWQLTAGPGKTPAHISACSRAKGSTVRALRLYDTIPARKRFLKREGSESSHCRQVFIEKALAYPRIAFRLTQDGRLKEFFPAAGSKKERFCAALLEQSENSYMHEIHIPGEGFSVDLVIGGPELYRRDRRMLYVFANGRRIQDYSLLNAIEYGVQGWFPNGVHPIGALFLYIDPALADFNIHPAKREARFKDPGAIHLTVSEGLKNFCRRHFIKDTAQSHHQNDTLSMELLSQEALSNERYSLPDNDTITFFASETHEQTQETIRYAGRAFGLFILAEKDGKLYAIDQHAAHERVLYNRFLSGNITRQDLLVPIVFKTESDDDDAFLHAKQKELAKLAIKISKDGGIWRIEALPAGWRLSDSETKQAILNLRAAGEHIAEQWAATLCCHRSVQDGDWLDETAALALAKEAFSLPDPHCPHGRPIWAEINRDALLKAVRRK